MTLSRRVKKLESAAPANDPGADRRRWDRALAAALAPLDDPDLTAAVAAELDGWGSMYAVFAGVTRHRLPLAAGRWPQVIRIFVAIDPTRAAADMRAALAKPRPPWPWFWLVAATQLRSRIPPDLGPSVLSVVADAYRADGGGMPDRVCDRCGLARPGGVYPDPPCPHCACAEWTWVTLTDEADRPWKALAAAELLIH